jgi:hypothetical protein
LGCCAAAPSVPSDDIARCNSASNALMRIGSPTTGFAVVMELAGAAFVAASAVR